MYDPSVGQFISRDPPREDGIDLLFEHPYVYARNNPVNRIDPSGLQSTTTDLRKVPVSRIQELVNEGIATEFGNGYVYLADVIGNKIGLYYYEPRGSRSVQRYQYRRDFGPPDPEDVSLVGRKVTASDYYRLVKFSRISIDADDPVDKQVQWFRGPGAAFNTKHFLLDLEDKRKLQLLGVAEGTLQFTLHMLPGGGAVDHAIRGDWGEFWISAAGDAAMFISGPGAKLFGAGRAARVVRGIGVAGQAAVAGERIYEGVVELRDGNTNEALGHFGEATLRLLGASKDTIRLIKEAKAASQAKKAAAAAKGAEVVSPATSPVSEPSGAVTSAKDIATKKVSLELGSEQKSSMLGKAVEPTNRAGVSEAGRALQSHSTREGSWLKGRSPGGNPRENTEAARTILSEILKDGVVTTKTHPTWGNVLEVRLPNGAGAIWKADGTFITFLERYTLR